jgi:hypothetical protein
MKLSTEVVLDTVVFVALLPVFGVELAIRTVARLVRRAPTSPVPVASTVRRHPFDDGGGS